MGISRRTPDAEREKKYELQTFTCIKCNHAQTRIVDAQGEETAK
jgi:transcription elongation factor Elf1